jgi:hypothetical protein
VTAIGPYFSKKLRLAEHGVGADRELPQLWITCDLGWESVNEVCDPRGERQCRGRGRSENGPKARKSAVRDRGQISLKRQNRGKKGPRRVQMPFSPRFKRCAAEKMLRSIFAGA